MKPICYKGEWFDSLNALHEKHAANGVSYASFYGRHKAGWSIKDALATPRHKREMRTFDVDGIMYPTLVELANAAGITYLAAVKRCHRGWSDGEIFHGRQKPEKPAKVRVARGIPVVVAGVQYKNIGHAHSSIRRSLTLNAVKARLRYGWSYEQAFGLETKIDGRALPRERSRSPRTKQQYVAFGKTYRSVASLARAHTMDQHLVYNRLRKGWTAERAVTEPATQTVEVNGHIYRSAMNAWKEIGETSFFVFNARKVSVSWSPLPAMSGGGSDSEP